MRIWRQENHVKTRRRRKNNIKVELKRLYNKTDAKFVGLRTGLIRK